MNSGFICYSHPNHPHCLVIQLFKRYLKNLRVWFSREMSYNYTTSTSLLFGEVRRASQEKKRGKKNKSGVSALRGFLGVPFADINHFFFFHSHDSLRRKGATARSLP